MTAPITSNRPTTTRLHHYAGRHSHGSGIPVETFFAPAWGASTPVEIFFAHAHPKWLIFDHFHLAGAIFLSQRHPKLPPGATQGRSFFHTAPRDDTESPPVWRAPRGMEPGRGAHGRRQGQGGPRDDAPRLSAHQAPLVWRVPEYPEGLAAVPVGGGGAWPRCPWVAAGPGRASRSTTPSAARVWRSRGRAAAHRHTQRPGPQDRKHSGRAAAHGHTEQPGPAGTRVRQRGGYRSTRPLSAHSATASSRLRPNVPQSWRRRRIHRNMPPTTAAPRPAPPIRPSKPVRARPRFGLVAGTSGAT